MTQNEESSIKLKLLNIQILMPINQQHSILKAKEKKRKKKKKEVIYFKIISSEIRLVYSPLTVFKFLQL